MAVTNPYDVLGLTREVTDEQVREAYLRLVRSFPPDTEPKTFNRVSEAYDKIKDERARLEYDLFSTEPGIERPFEALVAQMNTDGERRPLDYEGMMDLLRECLEYSAPLDTGKGISNDRIS